MEIFLSPTHTSQQKEGTTVYVRTYCDQLWHTLLLLIRTTCKTDTKTILEPLESRDRPLGELGLPYMTALVGSPYFGTYNYVDSKHCFAFWHLSYKINYIIRMKSFLNPKGHQNGMSGLKVTVILLKGLILPIGGVALGRFCNCSLHSRLVSFNFFQCL